MSEPLFGGSPDAGYTPETDTEPATFKDQNLPGGFNYVPPTETKSDWMNQALDQITGSIKDIMNDTEKTRVLIALALASGSTFLLFYTDTPSAAVTALGNAVPDQFNVEVGV